MLGLCAIAVYDGLTANSYRSHNRTVGGLIHCFNGCRAVLSHTNMAINQACKPSLPSHLCIMSSCCSCHPGLPYLPHLGLASHPYHLPILPSSSRGLSFTFLHPQLFPCIQTFLPLKSNIVGLHH